MEFSEARSIVHTLAKGIDPITGEVFGKDSPYNEPRIIRALFAIHAASFRGADAHKSPEERRQENIDHGRPCNFGLRWSDEDRKRVAAGFAKGVSIADLASGLERTGGAIRAELIKQGLLDPEGEDASARRGGGGQPAEGRSSRR